MRLKSIELNGFKSFGKKTTLEFASAITAIVGPNGSGKSNIAESFRFVLGEQSMKSMRGRRGEDLIWSGSPQVARAGRASVKLVFDNVDRAFNLDFDEVALERVVFRDGGNEYRLNGSVVRLRDIVELLAHANIGASGHHIISQGEADRILSSSSRDRREMIEDALGLTAFYYKREDAEKKLEKTAENMREAEALRREIAPHLKFLTAQVKKVEESKRLREDLAQEYQDYFHRENIYLTSSEALLKEERDAPEREKQELDGRIATLRVEVERKGKTDGASHELVELESRGRDVRDKRSALTRELGRLEGEISAGERFAQDATGGTVPAKEAVTFAEKVAAGIERILVGDSNSIKEQALELMRLAREFISQATHGGRQHTEALEKAKKRKAEIERELHELQNQEEHIRQETESLRKRIDTEKDASREAERDLFAALARRSELEGKLESVRARADLLAREKEAFAAELREAGVLVGPGVYDYAMHVVRDQNGVVSDAEMLGEDRGEQEKRRKRLERLKIKLEEAGASNADEIMREFQETSERDEFLARELADLEISAEHLRQLVAELTATLEVRFRDGIEKINAQFDAFFKLMFGGGSASLSIVKEKKIRRGASEEAGEEAEEEEVEEGVEISVSLPLKRVKGLHMLSGGERALTSIALIFAMSQVNPPPFLILDETDAALDEANSRRYGDMIETLGKKSQLIIITHNRETMSRAGILYGITMGSDGVSKLLSVKFEEAVAVAK